MALINHATREISAKIVYYGREGVGKRVSLKYIYDRIKPLLRGELKTVAANGDALLSFDFSPFEHPVFGGYRIRFHMCGLTGAVKNPAAWKMTLKGADGVMIVADASPEKVPANRESISRLRGFLAAYGVGLHDIPCVLQLARVAGSGRSPEDGIAEKLDVPDMRTCFSEAGSGEGVLEALSLLSRDIMARIGQDDTLRACGRTVTPEVVRGADDSAGPIPLETEELLLKPASDQSIAKPEKQAQGEEGRDRLQVALPGWEDAGSEGTVRIPLEITLGGVSRRLVVSIALEPA
jgi:signal recognition particle receptor subunit beta